MLSQLKVFRSLVLTKVISYLLNPKRDRERQKKLNMDKLNSYCLRMVNLLFLLFVYLPSFSQAINEPVKIGNQCPDFEFKNIINSKREVSRLSDYRGKLVILDFWTIWCKSCIEGMRKMQTLQDKYGEKVQIITVNGNQYIDKQALLKFWSNNSITNKLSLPCINDSLLYRYFPHNSIPHEVWIDKDGKLLAVTSAEYVSAENIENALEGKNFYWSHKQSIDFDSHKPLLSIVNENHTNSVYYTALVGYFKGDEQARGEIALTKDSSKKVARSIHVNSDIISLYRRAFSSQFSEITKYDNRIIVLTNDSSKFYYDQKYGYRDQWSEEHKFCYEAMLPLNTTQSEFDKIMQLDLDKFFRLKSFVAIRDLLCYVIIPTSARKKSSSKVNPSGNINSKLIEYASSKELVNDINGLSPIPVIASASLSDKLDITVENPDRVFRSYDLMKEWLYAYGLELVKTRKQFACLVIKDFD